MPCSRAQPNLSLGRCRRIILASFLRPILTQASAEMEPANALTKPAGRASNSDHVVVSWNGLILCDFQSTMSIRTISQTLSSICPPIAYSAVIKDRRVGQ
jgi:hypothetical protein